MSGWRAQGFGLVCIANRYQRTLAEVVGSSGTVHRIGATIRVRSPAMLRSIRLDIYWDGASISVVSAPLGDFFGHALGRCVSFASALLSSPEGRRFNCSIPMPFRAGMKIVMSNESATDWAICIRKKP